MSARIRISSTLPKADFVARHSAYAVREGDCLITVASKTSGYGQVCFRGRNRRLHRLVLEVKLGRDLAPGEFARHKCHNRACINPDHLEVGSHQDNMDDMVRAGRGRGGRHLGEAHPHAKLTAEIVKAIRADYAAGDVSLRALAKVYGIHHSTLSDIVRRRSWTDV